MSFIRLASFTGLIFFLLFSSLPLNASERTPKSGIARQQRLAKEKQIANPKPAENQQSAKKVVEREPTTHLLSEELSPWETDILKQIHAELDNAFPTEQYFSKEHLEGLIYDTLGNFMESDFRIIEVKFRKNAPCQLLSWYAFEVLEQMKEKVGIDLLLLRIFAVDQERFALAANHKDFQTLLTELGIKGIETLKRTPTDRVYYYLEAWLQYRMLVRLVGTEKALSYMELVRQKNVSFYTLLNKDELNTILFETHLRKSTLVIAFHDGLPVRQDAMDFGTVKYFFVFKFNPGSGKWEVQSTSSPYPEDYMATKPFPDYIKTIQPEEEQNYIVVHLGHPSHVINKDEITSFIHATGMDKIGLKLLLQNTKDMGQIPGEMSIFHFNVIWKFKQSFFKENVPTYSKPHDTGYYYGGGDTFWTFEGHHPISFAFHRPPRSRFGISQQQEGVSITVSLNGYKLLLRTFNEGLNRARLEDSYFVRTMLVHPKEGGNFEWVERTYNMATEEDWKQFLDILKVYVLKPIAPRVAATLEWELGLNAATLQAWEDIGPTLIKNGEKKIEGLIEDYITCEASHRNRIPTSVTCCQMKGKLLKVVWGDMIAGMQECAAKMLPSFYEEKVYRLGVHYTVETWPQFERELNSKDDAFHGEPKSIGAKKEIHEDYNPYAQETEDEEIRRLYRAYVAKIQKIWIDGARKDVKIHMVPADGDCGAAALGIPREQFIEIVLTNYYGSGPLSVGLKK